jgi:hypothetical protein
MKTVRLFVALIVACLLAGCGGGSSSSVPDGTSVQPPPAAAASPLHYDGSPLHADVGGIRVDIAAAALSKPTEVGLDTASTAPEAPYDPDWHPLGPFLRVDIGDATIQGPVTFSFPATRSSGQLWAYANHVYVPLEAPIAPTSGSLSGVLDFNPEIGQGPFYVGVLESPESEAPPHENWASWNGYVFRPAAPGNTGHFEKIVSLGMPVGSGLPPLGDRPILFVHGLGSSISGGTFDAAAQYLAEHGGATAIIGFEYDSLDAISNNGAFLRQALNLFASSGPTPPSWSIVAHSMGTLVTRAAIEGAGPLPLAAHNRAVLMCGPHLGTRLLDILESRSPELVGQLLDMLGANGFMEFRNRDGKRCKVTGLEQGVRDLRTDSPFLAALNVNASQNHPTFDYFTMAGAVRRSMLEIASRLIGIKMDDGLVDISSAGWNGLGQRESSPVMEFDHLTVNMPYLPRSREGDGDISFPEIQRLLSI